MNRSIFIYGVIITVIQATIVLPVCNCYKIIEQNVKTNSDNFHETLLFYIVILILAVIGLAALWRNQKNLLKKEKKISEKTPYETEERYRIIFDKAPLSYQSLDASGNILDVNQTWLETFGYERKEIIGKWFGIFIAPTYLEEFKQCFPVLKDKGKIHSEFEMIHKDGTFRFISIEGRTAKDADGNFIQTHGILQDITLQKRAELERQVIMEITGGITTTSKLYELLEMIHHSLQKVLYADNFFVALYDQKSGLFNFPYFADQQEQAPPPVAMWKSCSAYVIRTGKPLLLTPEVFRQLSEQNEVELVGSLSKSWIGVPLLTSERAIGVLVLQHYEKENIYTEHNIQFLNSIASQIALSIEHMQAENDLQNERLLLRTLIDNLPDSIYSKDIHARKTLVNLAEMRFTRARSENEILGKNDFELFPKELAERFFIDDQIVLQTGQPILNREEYVLDENENKRWLLTSKIPLHDNNGHIIGLVGIGRDITDRKQVEEEISHKNVELQQMVALKDKFFSIIAHDLRSPFNGFLGLTQIMAEELADLTKDEIQKIVERMQSSAHNLFCLLENLLEWAKMQQDLLTFEPKSIALHPTVDECIMAMLELAKIKEIEILNNIPSDIKVFADSNMLQTIFRNLISNAIKFTPKGGIINISAKTTDDKKVEISVKDTGIGMNQERIENLFRIDIQTNRKGTEGEPSTGLGLLLCKEFIEKHGGNLWIESDPEGKSGWTGSIFYFTIPPKSYSTRNQPRKALNSRG